MIQYDIQQSNSSFCHRREQNLHLHQHSKSKEEPQISDEGLNEDNDIGFKPNEDELSNVHYDSDEKEPYKNNDNYKESDVDGDDVLA